MRIFRAAALSAAVCFATLLSSGAQATFIFDQSVPLTNESFGFVSDPDGQKPNQVADDFQFAGARTLTDVQWWGVYEFVGLQPIGSFTIRIFGDINGAPGINPLYDF